MHIIVDGYNLIRQSKELSRLDREDLARGREALIERLAAYRRLKPHRITVVFDGAQAPAASPPRDRAQGIAVVFSRGGESADAVVVRMARQEAENALVVSSDVAVIRSAESRGAATIGSLEFEARLVQAAAMAALEPPEAEAPARRVSTRKKGEGRRLPKRLRRQQLKTAKL